MAILRPYLTVFLIFLLLTAGTAIAKVVPGYDYVPGEVIVKFNDNVTSLDKGSVLAQVGGRKVRDFNGIKAEHWQVSVSVVEAVADLESDPRVAYAQPNYTLQLLGIPNDTRFGDLWGMNNTGQTVSGDPGTADADIDAVEAWDVYTGSTDVLVAVIDTGVDYNHPDLVDNAWTNPGEIAGNGIDDDGNGYVDDMHGYDFANNDADPMDDNGHGTHCSGTIGGTGNNGVGVTGVAWDVSIMGLKFLTAAGSGDTADAIGCIEYATAMGADIMSNSWGGGPYDAAMEAAITAAYNAGIFFVAAAGNAGDDNDVGAHYPSNYEVPNVISVMATNNDDTRVIEPGWWSSNYGATSVDIAAPGLHIWSTTPNDTYSDYSGTSMATPHVSGALALMVGRFPGITVDAGKNLLLTVGNDPLASLTGLCVSESRLNVLKLITDPDIIDPSAVVDLAAGSLGSNWAELVWSAPGDDGAAGTANSYDMRWSLAPITDELTWDAATQATGEPLPAIVGTPESMQVGGLDVQTTYYFNLRARDEYGNLGGLSNSATVTTLGPPSIGLAPATLSATLTTGGTITETLTVTNTGLGVLDFSIPTAEYILPAKGTFGPVRTWDYDRAEKGAEIGLKPVVGIDGSGGPDAYGYNWIDSNEVGGPAFNWIEINTLGAAVSLIDDANSGPFAIGFPFSYYDVDYTNFQICSNGWLSFTDTGNDMSNGPLPAGTAPANMLALFWDDLNPETGGNIYYYNDGTCLIVEFENINHYDNGSTYTMQAHLYPNGKIEYHYLTVTGTADSGTIGLQNGDGTDGLTAVYNAAYVQDNLAVRFAAVTPWLSTTPNSGSLAAGASASIDVVFSAAGLCGSHFDANLHVVSNDALNSDAVVPVGLDLTGAPDILVDAATMDFGSIFILAQSDLILTVSNNGCADLTLTNVASDHPDFVWVATVPTVIAPGASLAIPVSFVPTTAGIINGILTLTSDDPNTPVLSVNLTGEGLNPGEVVVNPTLVYQVVNLEGTAAQTVSVTNNGLGDLNFTIPSPDMYNKYLAEMDPVKPIATEAGVKGTKDDEFGIVPQGSGGPDLYGYKWVDSDEPGGPMFGWVDITASGTVAIGSGDDSNLGPFPIGFPFEFYGNTFTEFRVSTNGFISFTSSATAFSNATLPSTSAPENMIAPFWDDLNLNAAGSGDIYYEVIHGDLVVMYDNVMPYSSANSGAGPFSFEVILSPTGRITMQYLSVGTGASSYTVGIQDGTGTIALQMAYNALYLHDNMVVEIRTPINWLTVSPLAGTVPAGGSLDLAVDFNAAGLAVGLHDGQFLVLSDDPATPSVPVPVTLEISDLSPVHDNILPRVVALDQNVPNPFNPMTDIKFSLPQESQVELRVYNVRGALVRNLISGKMEAGHHTQVWMGRDDQGQTVPSGVYFYRLQLDDEVLTRRMTLLK